MEREDYNLFDVLGGLTYGLNPLTRTGRANAFTYELAPWLATLPPQASATIKAMTAQFSRGGTEELENPEIFRMPEVRRAAGLDALTVVGNPADLLTQTKVRLFAA